MTRQNYLPEPGKRIAVAMSGGVDSSVAAWLLAKQGYDIVGVTAWTLNGPGKCCNDALVNAGRVCEMLGVPYDTVDLRAEFSHYVMDYYNNSYQAGLTPNPCVECNRYVKWELLVDYARKELGADYLATGHYARIQKTAAGSKILRGVDERKDQTYMMARVYKKDLEHTIFPLGDMVKPDVVAMAVAAGLPTAHSKESQDVCFVLDGQANYLKGVFGSKPGPIIDKDTGKVLGEHDGYYHYTIGQRRGVKVAAGRPIYVVEIDPKANTVYVGDAHHLLTESFSVLQTSWLEPPATFPAEVMVKIRYNTPPQLADVSPDPADPSRLIVTLREPQTAVTPGQIAAFYDPTFTELWGGGYIEAHLTHPEFDASAPRELPDLHCQLMPANL